MKFKKKSLIVIFAMVMLVALVFFLKDEENAGKQVQEAIKVRTAVIQLGQIEQSITLTGEIKPLNYVEVKPKISGRLERLALDNNEPVVEGTWVREGQVLAVLEHKDLAAQASRAQAAVQTARAGLESLRVDMRDKERDKIRMENLFKEGSVPEKQKDTAVAAYERAVADLEGRRALLVEAQAQLELAKVTLDEAFLKAPFTGVVSEKCVDAGDMLNPSTVLVSIVPMEKLKFLVDIPAKYLPKISPDFTKTEVSVEAYPDLKFESWIERLYPTVKPQTRTVTIEINIKNVRSGEEGTSEFLLRPGMYATARIILERHENVITVPADSLIRHLDDYYAFVVSNNVAHRRIVKMGMWSGERVEILEGISIGEQIVISGQHKLTDSTLVEVIEGNVEL